MANQTWINQPLACCSIQVCTHKKAKNNAFAPKTERELKNKISNSGRTTTGNKKDIVAVSHFPATINQSVINLWWRFRQKENILTFLLDLFRGQERVGKKKKNDHIFVLILPFKIYTHTQTDIDWSVWWLINFFTSFRLYTEFNVIWFWYKKNTKNETNWTTKTGTKAKKCKTG